MQEILPRLTAFPARNGQRRRESPAFVPRWACAQVAANGDTPVALNFQQAFNAPNSPWLTLVRNAVLGDGATIEKDNDEITAILAQ